VSKLLELNSFIRKLLLFTAGQIAQYPTLIEAPGNKTTPEYRNQRIQCINAFQIYQSPLGIVVGCHGMPSADL